MSKFTLLAICAAISLRRASSHYVFNRLIVNNTVSTEFQYVRDTRGNSGENDLWLKAFGITGPQDGNITCGRMAFPILNPNIQTATIVAGEQVGFMVSGPFFPGEKAEDIWHEGPGQVFMSQLPKGIEDLKDYDGSGDWFKVGYTGPANSTTWSLKGQYLMNFTVPKTTPPGKYLLRIEQFLASGSLGESQWYVNCAHAEVVGAGGGTPGPLVQFPLYQPDDPSVWFHDGDIMRQPKDITVYIEPKPAIWKG